MHVDLLCGLSIEQQDLERLLVADSSSVVWDVVQLPPAPGLENIEEWVCWPKMVAGVTLPKERIAFFRSVRDTTDGYVGYSVESLAAAVAPNRTTFAEGDFRLLLSTTSRDEAERQVLDEIRHFYQSNMPKTK